MATKDTSCVKTLETHINKGLTKHEALNEMMGAGSSPSTGSCGHAGKPGKKSKKSKRR